MINLEGGDDGGDLAESWGPGGAAARCYGSLMVGRLGAVYVQILGWYREWEGESVAHRMQAAALERESQPDGRASLSHQGIVECVHASSR